MLRRYINLGLGLLILLAPFQIYFNFYKHLSVSFAQILAGVIFILWLLRVHKERDYAIEKAPLNIPIVLFILIMFASIFVSTNKPHSLKYAIKWVSPMMIYFIVVNNVDNLKDIKHLLRIVIASGIVLALIGIGEFILGRERVYEFVRTSSISPLIFEPETLKVKLSTGSFNWLQSPIRAFGTFACAIGYAAYMGLIIPPSIFMLKRKGQPLMYAGILLMIIAVILSFTRSAWLGMVISLPLILWLGRRWIQRLHLSFIVGISMIVILLLSPYIKHRLKTFVSHTSHRIALWENAIDVIKARPILGVGVANYEEGRKRFAREDYHLPAHSNYLQIGAEMGLLGLSCFVWIIIGGMVSSLRIFKRGYDEEMRLLGLGFLGLWIWFAIQSHFATYYESTKFWMLFWLLVGLNMSLYREEAIKITTRVGTPLLAKSMANTVGS